VIRDSKIDLDLEASFETVQIFTETSRNQGTDVFYSLERSVDLGPAHVVGYKLGQLTLEECQKIGENLEQKICLVKKITAFKKISQLYTAVSCYSEVMLEESLNLRHARRIMIELNLGCYF